MVLEILPLSRAGATRESKRDIPVRTASLKPPLIKKIKEDSAPQQSQNPVTIANLPYDNDHFPPLPSMNKNETSLDTKNK